MALAPFIWGEGGQALTPEQVARKRELAELAASRAGDTSPVGHWTQGAARVVDALGGVLNERRADKAETAGMSGADDFIANNPVLASLINGTGSGVSMGVPSGAETAPSVAGAAPSVPAGAGAIRAGLIERGMPEHIADAFILNFQDESGLNPGINEANPIVAGSKGGFGLSQWTGPRRRALEAFAAEQGVPVDDTDMQLDFLMYELQGPESAAAQSIFNAQDTGTAAAAIVNKFLRPAEEHRARREARYLGGAQPQISPTQASYDPSGGGMPQQDNSSVIAALSSGMADPWVAKKYGPVLQALMGQQMRRGDMQYQQQMQQSDPAYQLGLQKAQIELEQMRNPAAPKPIEVGGVLLDPQTYEPIYDSRQQAEGGFTLSPGQQRFDAQGNPIASGAPVEAPRPMNAQDRAEWGIPPDDKRPYVMTPDGPKVIGGGGVTVNNDLGGDKFEEAFAKGDATALGTISESGMAAQRNLGRIDQLEGLLSQSPTGLKGVATQLAGEWGINTDGLSEVQAAQALINSMVPEQRQPGSGPMSDADLALFKQSLPRIINQPGGNEMIIQTMRGIAQYDAEGAAIVQQLRAGQIDRAQAFAALQSRENPLKGFKAPRDTEAGGTMGGDIPPLPSGLAEKGVTPEQWPSVWNGLSPDAQKYYGGLSQ